MTLRQCHSTLETLNKSGKDYIIKAIEQIYFVSPNKCLSSKKIGERVKRFAFMCPASERSVYRWLKIAREIFAQERGLNLTIANARKK